MTKTVRPAPGAASVAVLLIFAAVIRGGVLFAWHDRLAADPDGYASFARQQFPADGQVQKVSAYRPPLYPLLLSGLRRTAGPDNLEIGIAVAHLLLGVAAVAITVSVARAAGIGRASLLAGLVVAVDPILLHQSTQVMTETLATCLTAACLALIPSLRTHPSLAAAAGEQRSDRTGAMLAGATTGLAALCRPVVYAWLVMVLFVLASGGRWRRNLPLAIWLAVAAVVICLPWTLRNYLALDFPTPATTHGGYTLRLGNNPYYYHYLKQDDHELPWNVDDPGPAGAPADSFAEQVAADRRQLLAGRDPVDELRRAEGGFAMVENSGEAGRLEVEMDRLHYRRAIDQMRDDPQTGARSCLVRVGSLWRLVPRKTDAQEEPMQRPMRYAAGAWYGFVFLLAVVGLWKLRRRMAAGPWLWALLLCTSFTAVHTFYWTDMRMRAPLVPAIALFAASALTGRPDDPVEEAVHGETHRRDS